jgi:hypothetical protein
VRAETRAGGERAADADCVIVAIGNDIAVALTAEARSIVSVTGGTVIATRFKTETCVTDRAAH